MRRRPGLRLEARSEPSTLPNRPGRCRLRWRSLQQRLDWPAFERLWATDGALAVEREAASDVEDAPAVVEELDSSGRVLMLKVPVPVLKVRGLLRAQEGWVPQSLARSDVDLRPVSDPNWVLGWCRWVSAVPKRRGIGARRQSRPCWARR